MSETITLNNQTIPASMTKEEITQLVEAKVPEMKKKVMDVLRAFGKSTPEALQMKGPDKIAFIATKYAELNKGKKAAPAAATKAAPAVAKGAAKGPAKKAPEPEPEAEEEEEAAAEEETEEAAVDPAVLEALSGQITELKDAVDSTNARLEGIEAVLLEIHMIALAVAGANGLDVDSLKEMKDTYYGKLITAGGEGNE